MQTQKQQSKVSSNKGKTRYTENQKIDKEMTGGSGTTQSGETISPIASLQTSRQTKSDNAAPMRQTRSKSKSMAISVSDMDPSPEKKDKDEEMVDQNDD